MYHVTYVLATRHHISGSLAVIHIKRSNRQFPSDIWYMIKCVCVCVFIIICVTISDMLSTTMFYAYITNKKTRTWLQPPPLKISSAWINIFCYFWKTIMFTDMQNTNKGTRRSGQHQQAIDINQCVVICLSACERPFTRARAESFYQRQTYHPVRPNLFYQLKTWIQGKQTKYIRICMHMNTNWFSSIASCFVYQHTFFDQSYMSVWCWNVLLIFHQVVPIICGCTIWPIFGS